MKYVKWTLIAALVLIVGGFLSYTLPRHDIVRIVESEVRRVEFGGVSSMFWGSAEPSDATSGNRDVKFISAIRENGSPIVYRNEDTGWGWPPYFKLNSSDVQARAADLTSTAADPQWIKVKRYGWRNQFFSIYPNAVRLTPVSGPDVTVVPWFNIVFLTLFGGLLLFLWRLWSRFRERRIEPILEDVGEALGLDNDEAPAQTAPKPQAAPADSRGPWQRVRDLVMGRSGR
ncbi:MAG: DUF1523 family protein [Pseudomonadota bacterium]